MTVGRLGLSFLTSRLGEFRSVLLYLGLAVVLELIFWLVPSLITSAVTVALLGVVRTYISLYSSPRAPHP